MCSVRSAYNCRWSCRLVHATSGRQERRELWPLRSGGKAGKVYQPATALNSVRDVDDPFQVDYLDLIHLPRTEPLLVIAKVVKEPGELPQCLVRAGKPTIDDFACKQSGL